MDKTKKILIALLIILLLSNVIMYNEIKKINNIIVNMNNYIYSLDSQLNNISSNVNSLRNKEKLIQSQSYDINNIDEAYEKADVNFKITFNKLSEDAIAYVLYRKYKSYNYEFIQDSNITDDEKWNKVKLEKIEALDYKTQIQLSYDYNYEMQVYVEGDKISETERLSSIDLLNKLNLRLDINSHFNTISSNGTMSYIVEVENNYRDDDKLKLKSIVSRVYYKDKLIDEIDILEDGESKDFEHMPLERWSYNGNTSFEPEDNSDPSEYIHFETVVIDKMGKKYVKEFRWY